MRRRDVFALLGGSAMSWPLAARAQHKPMPVIGYLGLTSPEPSYVAPLLLAFRQGLAETGYVEGQNVAIEYRWAEGHAERLPELALDLVARNVNVIATHGGTVAARVAKEATSTIPVVFETGLDPVSSGLVASMARPMGNLTGISILTGELNPKRLQLLSELVPNARLIAILVNPNNVSAERVLTEIRTAAGTRGLEVLVVPAVDEQAYENAFSLAQAKAGALLVANDPVFFSHHERLVTLAAQHAIPAIYEWREFVEAGGLMSYGTSIANMHREKGRYVGRILAGAQPADLPVKQPTAFELVINLKTAKALGLTVPQSLLQRADEVIE